MKGLPVLLGFLVALGGCASQQEQNHQNKMWALNEQRMNDVEKNIVALNEQVSYLNNRVYEVRSAKGRKTGMTVVPVVPVSARNLPNQNTQATPTQQAHPTVKPVAQKPAHSNTKHEQRALKKGQAKPKALAQPNPMTLPAPSAQMPPETPQVAALPPSLPPSVDSEPALPPTLPMEAAPATQIQANVAPAPVPSSRKSVAPVATRAQAGEEASYKQALQVVRQGRSQEGIQRFKDFLSRYPNGKYAPNAEFWIGECYFSQGKYREALNQYATVNARFPRHHKNADALLKSGMAYKRLGDTANARANYDKLYREFPRSEAAARARSGR